ncbi:uncharacterized protein LOC108927387 isoform X2 [Scleropages formosus]|uniref:uncharacterized protein LOC108927387 isoform X2 n=1 Tax=Scleropages formosus TaxID=113540 RepID=UPI000878F730|nr:uncharacterized protein LOC108927387 isoform X2 [Scleropages formosus]
MCERKTANTRGKQSTMASIEVEEDSELETPLFRQYHASEMLPSKKLPLHNLLVKQPMSMGAVQTVCGIMIFGLGVTVAVTPTDTLGIVLRVPIVTGILFFISGLLSFLLFKFPVLLPISYTVNIGSLVVAVTGMVLLTFDLFSWKSSNSQYEDYNRVTALILTVTLLEICITAVLLRWLHVEYKGGSVASKNSSGS